MVFIKPKKSKHQSVPYLLLMSKSKIVFFLFGDETKIEFHFEHAFLIIIVFDFASIHFLFREQQINRQEKHHVKM